MKLNLCRTSAYRYFDVIVLPETNKKMRYFALEYDECVFCYDNECRTLRWHTKIFRRTLFFCTFVRK